MHAINTNLDCALRMLRRCSLRRVSDELLVVCRLVLVREKQDMPGFILGYPLLKDCFQLSHFGIVMEFQQFLVGCR